MDQNRDWKVIAALVLGGLALLVALGGPRGYGNDQVSAVPQPVIIQPAAPSTGPSGGMTAPAITLPAPQAPDHRVRGMWGGWGPWESSWHMFPFFALFFFGGLIFLAFWIMRRSRRGWGGPGPYGGAPWSAHGPGPQPPQQGQQYNQYPPQQGQQPYGQYPQQYPPQYQQYPQGQGQPYQGYPQGQQPQQEQPPQPQPPEANGDITRPEGTGDY